MRITARYSVEKVMYIDGRRARRNCYPAYVEHEKQMEIRAGRGTLVGRVALEERAVQIADAWNDPDYEDKEAAHLGDVRAMLGVPLLRDGNPSAPSRWVAGNRSFLLSEKSTSSSPSLTRRSSP